jgi:hypothetical protein
MDRQSPPAGGLHQPSQDIANDRVGETGLPSEFEEDHLINLGIGGAPRDPHNLFPQPRTGPRSATVQDQEETQLHRDVCAGRTTLAAAQAQILADWTYS